MKPITQKECLEVLDKTPYPREGGDHRFVMRFMFKLNELAKKRGYRLFSWIDYAIQDEYMAGGWVLSNIEILSKEIIERKEVNAG